MSAGERKANRLAGESSPYLLQHAHNPVQWWPWGEPAFAEARRRGVPILLSVGYSTCYWCHVMERECFENEVIAKVMNDRFVSIKLDREERPDVDDIYMNALLVTRGNGGWPMNVFLEPTNLRPFWCGTYFPPAPARGMPSWTQILEGISEAWQGRRDEVVAQADQIAEAVRENLSASIGKAAIGEEQIGGALQQLLATFDKVNGGFGGAPKFPQPAYLEFLQDALEVAGDEQTRDAIFLCLKKTLDGMLCGGVYDQVGGGFHRYSVDATWTVPHFEKMLYDNAQLAAVYARGTEIDSLGEYERVARGTFDYVLREMTSPEGAFYSAQDAEVDGQEGLNYVWTMGELEAALQDPADVSLAARVYGVDKGPNFQDPHHPGNAPVSVLRLEDRLDRVAPKVNMEVSVLRERLAEINAKLYAARAQRTQPGRDDKVLASWNGLMISALARARHDLGEPRYLEAAERAAQFVLREMVDKGSGRLLRSWRAGRGGPRGFLEDSALVILAMIHVAEQRGDHEGQPSAMTASYLAAAEHLALQAVEDFKEVKDGRVRWCDTRDGEGDLFVRTSAMHDGVMPSGPSAMLDALLSLAMMTHKDVWKREAGDLLLSLSGAIAQSPVGSINATRGLIRVLRNAEMKGWVQELKASGAAAVQTPPAMAALATATNEGALPVEVYAAVDRVVVQEGVPAEFRIVLKIADGHHVLAAEPGAGGEGLVPLRVGIVHGSGVVAYADYPEGELYQGAIRVYRGTVEFSVVLEYVGPWKGRPLVALTYQACTDTECLLPVTVELDVAVDLQKH